MSVVVASSGESVYKISKWLGINENPDGDTELRAGEAAVMENFRITPDWSLQLRPGYRVIAEKTWGGEVRGAWHGRVGDSERTVFASGGALYALDLESGGATPILASGVAFTDDETRFFGFGGRLYIQNGHEYLEWDGDAPASPVAGYRPLVVVASPPSGGGTELERVNMLTAQRRVWFSPDGTAKTFRLPEGDLAAIDYVKLRATGAAITAFTADLTSGTVTFTTAPAAGTSSLEIGYTHSASMRTEVEGMRFSEIFNGSSDNRVFLYGDGTNRALYSGLDYDGAERADYFPDLNVLDIGASNTPITALIRHYSRLAVFKSDSAYSVSYGAITLPDGRTTAAFYYTPSNRSVGNEAPGEALLALNSPRTLSGGSVIEWRNYGSYAANLTSDERQAKIISSRASSTLGGLDLTAARTFFDREAQEYYVFSNGTAVVNGVATDTWYVYRDFAFKRLFLAGGELYGFTEDDEIAHLSRRYQNDGGRDIHAVWRSGSLSFGRDWRRKYSGRVFVTLKPEPRSHLRVSVRTNRSGGAEERAIASGLVGFSDASFAHWSFGTNRQPQTKRLKIRAKKFAYLQLVFESRADWNTATVLAADVRLRYAGEVR
ncbi:MAG: hypothetical protein LBN99_02895 [Oscillospiraceae bacterium]|jgi:hypothetical protein|nr:hypothetical protein [Oscillospiraceae bacterium]